MSTLFPHQAYAEDQRLSKTILTSHVLYRGFQSGAVVGLLVGDVKAFWLPVARGTTTLRSTLTRSFASGVLPAIQRSTGTGAIIGTLLMVPGLTVRMWGREDIEWKDRSWRLLENKGQVEVDTWSLLGEAGGLALGAATSDLKGLSTGILVRRLVGMAALGNLAGVAGYMVYRHGIKGGKFE